jgi:putative hydrolase of HD superfamily
VNEKEKDIIQLFKQGNQLKNTVRTGWVQRGVPEAENVAAHSYGVAFITLILAYNLDEPIDLAKALTMALLHDLPEALTSDIPAPAWRFLPAESKHIAEKSAIERILDKTDGILMEQWEELRPGESPEAKLVHDADMLDRYLQAVRYEEQFGNLRLQEFWQKKPKLHFLLSLRLYEEIRASRIQVRPRSESDED